MEKKKFTYRYNEDIEPLLEKGFDLYKHESKTPNFSLNQLIDTCIKKAVEDLPNEIKEIQDENTKLRSQLINTEHQKKELSKQILEIKQLINTRLKADEALTKLL